MTGFKEFEEVFINDTKDIHRCVQDCEEYLEKHKDSIQVEEWRQYYYVYRFIREKGKKTRRVNVFTLQCGTEGFNQSVENVIIGNAYYPCGELANNVLTKTLVILDRQNAKKAQKAKEAIAAKQQITKNNRTR